jgi:hypothetical protein
VIRFSGIRAAIGRAADAIGLLLTVFGKQGAVSFILKQIPPVVQAETGMPVSIPHADMPAKRHAFLLDLFIRPSYLK